MRSPKSLIGTLLGLALLMPATAGATCKKDSDCANNEHCEMMPCATSPCEPGAECPPTPCRSEGTCAANGPGSGCTEDANCPSGFVCEVMGASSCAAPVCEPGTECPPAPPCEPQEFKGCVPAPCNDDSECGKGLKCITFTQKDCPNMTTPACPPGEDCAEAKPAADPPECKETKRSICAPPYVAPCKQAADCGDGFECKPREQCVCSGGSAPMPVPAPEPEPDADSGGDDEGSGSGGSDSGFAPPPTDPPADPPEDQCKCTPTGENHCVPKQISCTAGDDSTCPEDWTCQSAPTPGCADAPPPSEPGSEPGSGSGSKSEPCPPAPAPESNCVPPAWNDWGWGGGPASSGQSYDDAIGRATGAENSGVTPEAPTTPSPEQKIAVENDSGCAVAGNSDNTPAALLLLLLGACGLFFRRRR